MASILKYIMEWFTGSSKETLPQLSQVPDETSGLSEKDIYFLKSSWEIVRKDLPKNGARMFEIFFSEHPETKSLFHRFEGVPDDKIMEHKQALAHACLTMASLGNFIYHIHDSSLSSALFLEFGKDHIKRKIYRDAFEGLPPVMIRYMSEITGSAWNKDSENAWNKFLQFMITASFDYLDK